MARVQWPCFTAVAVSRDGNFLGYELWFQTAPTDYFGEVVVDLSEHLSRSEAYLLAKAWNGG
jgi:hypothetical protein